jgi:hypothetical protein
VICIGRGKRKAGEDWLGEKPRNKREKIELAWSNLFTL